MGTASPVRGTSVRIRASSIRCRGITICGLTRRALMQATTNVRLAEITRGICGRAMATGTGRHSPIWERMSSVNRGYGCPMLLLNDAPLSDGGEAEVLTNATYWPGLWGDPQKPRLALAKREGARQKRGLL